MVLSAAKLASPPILGGLYAAFVEVGRPEMMFLAAGVSVDATYPFYAPKFELMTDAQACCLIGSVFLAPLVLAGRH